MSHSISNKGEITKKKKLIIEKSQALGFDVIGFANPMIDYAAFLAAFLTS